MVDRGFPLVRRRIHCSIHSRSRSFRRQLPEVRLTSSGATLLSVKVIWKRNPLRFPILTDGAVVKGGNECVPIRQTGVPRDAGTEVEGQPTVLEFGAQSLDSWLQVWSCKNLLFFGRCHRVLLAGKLRLLLSTFTFDTSAVSLASRERSIAIFLCSSRGRLFLRIIAPGVYLPRIL